MTTSHLRPRFWLELVAAVVTGALAVLTLIKHDWIEVFGIEPDRGNGAVEWIIVGVCALACVALAVLARREYRLAAA